jgi:dihydroorotase
MSDIAHTPDTITLIRPDDWHLHLRDGAAGQRAAAQRAPVRPCHRHAEPEAAGHHHSLHAEAYREPHPGRPAGGDAVRAADDAVPDRQHDPDEIRRAQDSGIIHAVKLYPAGATTNSAPA